MLPNWLSIIEFPQIQVGRHLTTTCRLLICPNCCPSNLPTLPTNVKHVVAQWIAILIMEDGGCSLIFAQVTNPNTIKVMAKSPCITHASNLSDCITDKEPKIGIRLRKLTESTLPTLWWILEVKLCDQAK